MSKSEIKKSVKLVATPYKNEPSKIENIGSGDKNSISFEVDIRNFDDRVTFKFDTTKKIDVKKGLYDLEEYVSLEGPIHSMKVSNPFFDTIGVLPRVSEIKFDEKKKLEANEKDDDWKFLTLVDASQDIYLHFTYSTDPTKSTPGIEISFMDIKTGNLSQQLKFVQCPSIPTKITAKTISKTEKDSKVAVAIQCGDDSQLRLVTIHCTITGIFSEIVYLKRSSNNV